MHPSDSGCSLHTGICRLQQAAAQQPAYERRAACCSMLHPAYQRRNASFYAGMQASYARMQPAYERMKAAYARTAAFMQGRMQPACLPSVNPALVG